MPFGEKLEQTLSRPTAKPYRSGKLPLDGLIHLDEHGSVDFSPGDIENPKNVCLRGLSIHQVGTSLICVVIAKWSTARRW